MNKLSQKIVAIATILSVAVMLAPVSPAQALTTADLQAQIAALQAQLAQLTGQLSGLQGSSTGLPAACVGISFNRNLTRGSVGNDVKCLQSLLNQLNVNVADAGAGSPGNETTYFGGATRAAVIRFQELYKADCLSPIGLTIGTGFVGSLTRGKLNGLLTGLVTPGAPVCGNGVCQVGESQTSCPTDCTGVVVPVGAGLTVSLADDNSAAATIVADSTSGDGAQALVPFVKVRLYNGDNADVKVTKLQFTRGGISADADISQAYLYDGDTQLAEYNSFSSTVLTFNNASGLFTVPKGSYKTITLKCDVANGTGAGKTIKFSVASASAVASDSSSVNGSFPLSGNFMSTASASDLGKLTVATTTGPGTSVDPQDGLEVINFTLAGSDQIIEVRRIKLTNIGSTGYADITNLRLYDGGVQIGDAVAQMATDKTVVFDLSSNPLVINKGITKSMHVRADITGGTNRTFHFTFQYMSDIVAYDRQYGVFIKPNQSDSWTVLYSGSASTISTGKLTLQRASDSPTSNVALSATNVTLAKFTLKATGEDAKIASMIIRIYGTVGATGIYQGAIYFDGVQMGNTTTSMGTAAADGVAANTTFTFGNTFVVPADGKTHNLEVKGDVKKGDGTVYVGNETLTVKVNTVTATGRTSSETVSVASASGFQLTIKTGNLAVTKNQAYGNWSGTYPTAIRGQTEALVGSFVVSAGASEGCDLTSIKVQYTTTTNSSLQNMKVYKGDKATGVQIGSTQSTITAATNYTFYPSPYISLAANAQFILNVYADLLTTAATGVEGAITIAEVDGVGKVTNSSVNFETDIAGQNVNFTDAGTLGVNIDTASNPNSTIISMGNTGVVLGKWKYSASTSAEDIKVTKIIATTTLGNSGVTSTLYNIKAYDGDTQIGSMVSSLADDASITFDLSSSPWVIPAWHEKILTLKGDVNTYPLSTSQSSTTVKIMNTTYAGAVSGDEASDVTAHTANFMNVYNTKPVVTYVAGSSSLTSGSQTLIKFTVKAEGNAAVKIYRFNFRMSLTDNATSTNLYVDDLTLYDESNLTTALNTAVSSSTLTATPGNTADGYGTTTVANSSIGKGGVDITDNSASTSQSVDVGVYKHAASGTGDASAEMDEIPAGETVTYVLKGTVGGNGANTEDKIIVELNDWTTYSAATSSAVVWGDQYTTSIPGQYVKSLPGGPSSLGN